ncbi:MAG: hypothetical protein KDA47_14810, partial [Planctomycetales bacterium]|nr:hypothetical protein [Planctomycetales bacterium]
MSDSQPPESGPGSDSAPASPPAPLNSSEVADTDADESGRLRLLIVPVIERADEIVATVGRDLPGHPGLSRAASAVADAARTAESVARRLRRWWGVHRLPALFLFLALAVFLVWMYWQFLHTSKLVIAISSRDAVQLRQNVDRRVQVVSRSTTGSRDSIQLLMDKQADLAFVQGGVDLPPQLIATELESAELVLLLLREGRQLSKIRTVLTSSEGQGSHSLAQKFTAAWGIAGQVRYIHDWRVLTEEDDYRVAPEVDAIFVVKDPTNERVTQVAHRLQADGFRLTTPDIGAAGLRMEYLEESVIRPGYLDPLRQIPPAPVPTYVVSTYLVARPGLTPRQMAAASHLRDAGGDR